MPLLFAMRLIKELRSLIVVLPWYCQAFHQLCRFMRKPDFCICESKDADQLCGNRATDQRLSFRCMDRTIPLLP